MAIDLKRKSYASQILGVENDPVNASAAERIGLVDSVVSIEECHHCFRTGGSGSQDSSSGSGYNGGNVS